MGNRMYRILWLVWLCMAMPWEVYAQGKNYTQTVKDVAFEMVYMEGGTFRMGGTEKQTGQADSDEYPVHEVTLTDYYIGKYEVTQRLWKAVMGSNPSTFQKGDDYPVESINWNDIQTFLRKLNQLTGRKYALPTEAQWEYAARSGSGRDKFVYAWCGGGAIAFSEETSGSADRVEETKYSGSDNINEVAWYGVNSGDETHPVGTKQPNALGIYDMSGNVWEWCSDWYGLYSSGPQTNPTGSSSGFGRILRGGSYYDEGSGTKEYRVSNRAASEPGKRYKNCGFRVVCIP